jgi:rRNA processing protein Krr1/Pno1
MKVYIAIVGVEYEYTDIIGVYKNKEKAQKVVDRLIKNSSTDYDIGYVKEFEIIN